MAGELGFSGGHVPDIVLRPYQADARREICRKYIGGCSNLKLVAPTGAGKTKIITSILHTLSGELKGALVATPMQAIETGFDEDITIKVRNHLGTTEVGSGNLYMCLREEHDKGARARDTIRGLSEFRAGLTTHAQLTTWGTEFLDDDLSDRLLVIDECHHVTQEEGTQLGDFARAWSERGGAVLYVTATPFRGDGKNVLPDDAHGFVWSLAEHSQGGLYAPENFVTSTVATDMEVSTREEYDGTTLPEGEELKEGYRAMVAQWLEEGCPKSVFMVPANNSLQWASALYDALLAEGLTPSQIVNGVGTDTQTKAMFNAAIASEKAAQTYEESEVQVFIACRRFDEGTDWQFCSHVFCWGVPSSLKTVLQKWGRAMRYKGHIPDYPDEFKNIAKITFFVHKIKEGSEERFAAKHAEYSWLLGTLLADWETGVAYRNSIRVRFDRAYARSKNKDDDLKTEMWQSLVLPDDVRLEARKFVEQCAMWQVGEDAPPSTAESILSDLEMLHAQGKMSEEVMAGVLQVICERMCGEDEEEPTPEEARVKASLETRLVKLVKKFARKMKKVKSTPKEWTEESSYIRKELAKVFRQVIDDYKDHSLFVDDTVVSNVTAFTGQDALEVAQRLRGGMSAWLISVESVSRALRAFYVLHNRCISSRDLCEDASCYFGLPSKPMGSWRSIDSAMRRGLRGYGKSKLNSIYKLNVHLGLSDAPPPISVESVSGALRAFYEEHGQCVTFENFSEDASRYFGRPPESMGTWESLNGAMHKARRGYGKSKLNSISKLNTHLGLRSNHISQKSVSEALRLFYEEHGRCVIKRDFSEDASRYFGRPPESMGTWGSINGAMRKARRGYDCLELYTIAKLNVHLDLRDSPPESPVSTLSISKMRVSEALRLFYEKHGRCVTNRDRRNDSSFYFGSLPGTAGTWNSIDRAMRQGNRGYGKSKLNTIAKLNKHLKLK